MGGISMHVLDLTAGRPAAGMRVAFSMLQADTWVRLATLTTNADGRSDQPLLTPDTMRTGRYELAFGVADYFRAAGAAIPDPPFLDEVVVRFGIADRSAHYHVPLLCTPWSYTTYRGN